MRKAAISLALVALTLTKYAKQKGLTRQRVHVLMQQGRLGDAVYSEKRGKSIRYFVTSAKAADEALEATSGSHGRAAQIEAEQASVELPPAPPQHHPEPPDAAVEMTLAEARRRKAVAEALGAEVATESKRRAAALEAGRLIPRDQAVADVVALLVELRTSLGAVPSRCKLRRPGWTADDVEVVTGEINQVLETIADGGAGEPG